MSLPPKAPPSGVGRTRTRSSGRSSSSARPWRVANAPWVALCTTTVAVELEPGGRGLRLEVGLVDPRRATAAPTPSRRRTRAPPRRRRWPAAGARRRCRRGPPRARRRPRRRPRRGRRRRPPRRAPARPCERAARRAPSRPRRRGPPRAARGRRRTASTPSVAAASVSATTSATGWPAKTTSSRASGSPRAAGRAGRHRQVGRRQHGDDARDRARRLGVDRGDPRVRLGRRARGARAGCPGPAGPPRSASSRAPSPRRRPAAAAPRWSRSLIAP